MRVDFSLCLINSQFNHSPKNKKKETHIHFHNVEKHYFTFHSCQLTLIVLYLKCEIKLKHVLSYQRLCIVGNVSEFSGFVLHIKYVNGWTIKRKIKKNTFPLKNSCEKVGTNFCNLSYLMDVLHRFKSNSNQLTSFVRVCASCKMSNI